MTEIEQTLAGLVVGPTKLEFPLDVDSHEVAIALRNGVPLTAFPGGRHRRLISPGVPMRGRREKVVIKTTEFPLEAEFGPFVLSDGKQVTAEVELRLRFSRDERILMEAVHEYSVEALVKVAAQILESDLRGYLRSRLALLSHDAIDGMPDTKALLDPTMVLMGGLFVVLEIDDVTIGADPTHLQFRHLRAEHEVAMAEANNDVDLTFIETGKDLIEAKSQRDQAAILGLDVREVLDPTLLRAKLESQLEAYKADLEASTTTQSAEIQAKATIVSSLLESSHSLRNNADAIRLVQELMNTPVGTARPPGNVAPDVLLDAGAPRPHDGGLRLRRDERILGTISDVLGESEIEAAALDDNETGVFVVTADPEWLRNYQSEFAQALRANHNISPDRWLFMRSATSIESFVFNYYHALSIALRVRPPRAGAFDADVVDEILEVTNRGLPLDLLHGGAEQRARLDLVSIMDVRDVRILDS